VTLGFKDFGPLITEYVSYILNPSFLPPALVLPPKLDAGLANNF
jgi:hypothetical protein